METKNDITCKKCGAIAEDGTGIEIICKECGAIAKDGTGITYCPKCGKRFPGKMEKLLVGERAYNTERMSGYAPYGSRIIRDEEYNELKRDSGRFEKVFFTGLFIGGGILLLLFEYIVSGVWCLFGTEVEKEDSGKYGVYNHLLLKEVIPYEYDKITLDSAYNVYYVYRDSQIGVYDKDGNMTIPCDLDSIRPVGNDLSVMYRNGMQGVCNKNGHIIIPCENQYVFWDKKPELTTRIPGDYIGNIIPVKRSTNSGWDIYNMSGKRINLTTYQEAIQTGMPDLIKVKYNGYYGLINQKGEELVKCNADWILRFQEGMAIVYISKPYNMYAIDPSGNKITFPALQRGWELWPFSSGFMAVRNKENGKIGYYDKTGKLVIPYKFEQMKEGRTWINPSFQGDSARISYQGQNGYVFKDGTIKLDAN